MHSYNYADAQTRGIAYITAMLLVTYQTVIASGPDRIIAKSHSLHCRWSKINPSARQQQLALQVGRVMYGGSDRYESHGWGLQGWLSLTGDGILPCHKT